jgi:peptide/nickel transport system permease protein
MSAESVALPGAAAPPSSAGRLFRALGANFFVRSLVKAVATVLFVTSLTFFLVRLLPGSPVEVYIQDLMSQYSMSYDQAKDQASALYTIDLDSPLYVQYLGYLGHLSRGDLGTSLLSQGTPVSSIILRFLPWTLFCIGTALLISFVLGVALGMLLAYRRESTLDHALTALASATSSVPDYLIGLLLVVFLGIQWGLIPIAAMRGSLSPGMQPHLGPAFLIDALFHAALPIATYVLGTIGIWILTMKSSTIAALEEDYVTVARARGLRDSRIRNAYVGRNAILPLVTALAISAGYVVGGAVVIERLFVYQGIGYVLSSSIDQRDYTVMQGVFLTITLAVIFANLLADTLYGRLDPRIRLAGGGA